ncbi:MAG: hypothetical protein LKJ13_03730 [Clostridia bacterium]|nr:hypothetical protein [Clostridia bacterium]MCI2001061.1 hypothetical protein [Clostridia bacterium]MCI2015660.1 hypothetical protein [Clostridia bacterium]
MKRKEVAGKNYGIGMQKHVPNSAQPIVKDDKGKSRDVVAKKVGFKSGHEVDRGSLVNLPQTSKDRNPTLPNLVNMGVR